MNLATKIRSVIGKGNRGKENGIKWITGNDDDKLSKLEQLNIIKHLISKFRDYEIQNNVYYFKIIHNDEYIGYCYCDMNVKTSCPFKVYYDTTKWTIVRKRLNYLPT